MKARVLCRVRSTLGSLPDVYRLWPETDYQAVVSHSVAELNGKAWSLTGKQMQHAIDLFETRNPDVKRKLTATL